jgi:hypothetical protein
MEVQHTEFMLSLLANDCTSPPEIELFDQQQQAVADPYFDDMDAVRLCFATLQSQADTVAEVLLAS